jgi:tripartite-type tricarboxylate transporter receptor subunit TctC
MKKGIQRFLTTLALAAFVCAGLTGPDFAVAATKNEPFPTGEVNIYVGFAPGGNADTVARAMAKVLSKMWGQPVVITNKPGGNQAISFTSVVNARPDGHTITYILNPYLVLKKLEEPTLPYGPDSVTWLGVTAMSRFVLMVKGDFPCKTFEEFVSFGVKNPNKIIFGSDGTGGTQHLMGVRVADLTGIKSFIHVPFSGSAPKMQAMLGGHINATIQAPGGAAAYLKSGDIRYLLVLAEKRNPEYPAIPTAREKGLNLVAGSWGAFAGPRGLPAPIAEKLTRDIKEAAGNEEVVSIYKSMGYEFYYVPPRECVKLWKEDEDLYAPDMKKYGFIK